MALPHDWMFQCSNGGNVTLTHVMVHTVFWHLLSMLFEATDFYITVKTIQVTTSNFLSLTTVYFQLCYEPFTPDKYGFASDKSTSCSLLALWNKVDLWLTNQKLTKSFCYTVFWASVKIFLYYFLFNKWFKTAFKSNKDKTALTTLFTFLMTAWAPTEEASSKTPRIIQHQSKRVRSSNFSFIWLLVILWVMLWVLCVNFKK